MIKNADSWCEKEFVQIIQSIKHSNYPHFYLFFDRFKTILEMKLFAYMTP